MSKSFTLPGVEVGSIIEYQYLRTMPYGLVYDSKWLVSADLFTKRAVFSLKPSPYFLMRWSWPIGLPDSAVPTKQGAFVRYETRDVPAFVTEDHMPPEDAMKYRVEFIYEGERSDQTDAEAYWKAFGKQLHQRLTRFVKEDAELVKEVARLVQPGDNAETKARKLYARAQQLRNLTFERYRTEEELKREKIRENHDAEDVLEHGYAAADDITWTLYGLMRAAKLDASIVFVSPRDSNLFDPRLMNARQLSTCVVLVNLDDGAVFLDPGTPLMPFALLPWSETAISGFLLTSSGGKWVNTSLPSPSESRVERKAVLKLAPNGTLSGTLKVTYVGLEAAWRRRSQRNGDAAARKKFLESDVEDAVPSGIDVKLTNEPDWTNPEAPLIAQFDFTVNGLGGWRRQSAAGCLSGCSVAKSNMCSSTARECIRCTSSSCYQHTDDISIELPPGWQVTSVPQPRSADIKLVKFSSSAKSAGGTLNLTRQLEPAVPCSLARSTTRWCAASISPCGPATKNRSSITAGRGPGRRPLTEKTTDADLETSSTRLVVAIGALAPVTQAWAGVPDWLQAQLQCASPRAR